MSGIENLSGSKGIMPQQNTNKTKEGNVDNQNQNSIFGDKNNNGVVDKEDFTDTKMAELADSKGLLGKTWDSVKDMIGGILGQPQPKPMSEASKNDKADMLNYLKEKNIDYKENADGSVEYEFEGNHEKLYWEGDNSISQSSYKNSRTIESNYNFSDKTQNFKITDENSGFRQETISDIDGSKKTINYKKDENGEYIQTNEFLLSNLGDDAGKIYTGAEIAKLFNSEGFDLKTAEKFFRATATGADNVDMRRDGGSISVNLSDGTQILYENGIFDKGNVLISNDNGDEYYDKEGNKITNE